MSAAVIFVACGWPMAEVQAHDIDIPQAQATGYVIPAIDHASMAQIQPYRKSILRLAATVENRGPYLNALLLHNELQSANCLWELLPGSMTDESSPMNVCAHSDMAGLKAILDELRSRPETRSEANVLVGKLDEALVLNGSSYALCEFSQTLFYTGHQVLPDWKEVAVYVTLRRPQALILALFFLVSFLFLIRLLRNRTETCLE